MKKGSIFLISILCFLSSINSQTNATQVAGDAEITFETTKHDYGTIPYGGNGSYDYVFTNTGKTTLIITNCVKGCGCTDVSWTKEPIAPGQKGKITAADAALLKLLTNSISLMKSSITSPPVKPDTVVPDSTGKNTIIRTTKC